MREVVGSSPTVPTKKHTHSACAFFMCFEFRFLTAQCSRPVAMRRSDDLLRRNQVEIPSPSVFQAFGRNGEFDGALQIVAMKQGIDQSLLFCFAEGELGDLLRIFAERGRNAAAMQPICAL